MHVSACMTGIGQLCTLTTGRGKVKNFLLVSSLFRNYSGQPLRIVASAPAMIAGSMSLHLFHSAFAAHALFGLGDVSPFVGARFLRLRSATDLSWYKSVF